MTTSDLGRSRMRTTDLENLYVKIDGHILLVAAYTKNPYIIRIIRTCRLKPYSVFTGEFKSGTRFENHWVDEFGNSLRFEKQTPSISLHDIHLSANTNISTDLFCGNSIQQVAKNSKAVMILEGNCLGSDFYFVSFYGQDEYLRTFSYLKRWAKVSSLLMGIDTLQEFIKNTNNSRLTDIDVKRLDCNSYSIKKCIISPWPAREDIAFKFSNEILINSI